MAKVVFLQQNTEEWLGVMYLSSMLKSRGHRCDIYVGPLEGGRVVERALAEPVDVIAFSCLTTNYRWALEKAAEIKRRSQVLTIFGGTHVTLNAEKTIENAHVDIVCLGEGEYPILELAEAIDNQEAFDGIANLWVKKAGNVIRNEIRDLVQDLDSLPFPDRKLYTKYAYIRKNGRRPLCLSRGCPYQCSYCHNARKRALFENKGKYVRWRSVESILAEIEEIKRKGFVSVLHFIDDGFGINRQWLKEFLERLSSDGGERLAVQANMRADMVTEDLCDVFVDYGARLFRIRFAVECGDEEYRRQVLRKNISNEALLRAASIFHEHEIDFVTYNMVGLPGETLPQALETLRLNIRLRPSLAICFVYQPYPGTELADYALRMCRGYSA
jgi:anaerobic magnesium-protoporphyrin IX monomethyl ester cyclase